MCFSDVCELWLLWAKLITSKIALYSKSLWTFWEFLSFIKLSKCFQNHIFSIYFFLLIQNKILKWTEYNFSKVMYSIPSSLFLLLTQLLLICLYQLSLYSQTLPVFIKSVSFPISSTPPCLPKQILVLYISLAKLVKATQDSWTNIPTRT